MECRGMGLSQFFQLKGLYDRTRETHSWVFFFFVFFLRCDGPNLQLQRFLNSVRKPIFFWAWQLRFQRVKLKEADLSVINLEAKKGGGPKTRETKNVLFIPSLVRVRRPCRGLEKFFPPVLQRCYGCSFHAQEIVHTGHGMLGYFLFFFLLERKVPAQSKLKE